MCLLVTSCAINYGKSLFWGGDMMAALPGSKQGFWRGSCGDHLHLSISLVIMTLDRSGTEVLIIFTALKSRWVGPALDKVQTSNSCTGGLVLLRSRLDVHGRSSIKNNPCLLGVAVTPTQRWEGACMLTLSPKKKKGSWLKVCTKGQFVHEFGKLAFWNGALVNNRALNCFVMFIASTTVTSHRCQILPNTWKTQEIWSSLGPFGVFRCGCDANMP